MGEFSSGEHFHVSEMVSISCLTFPRGIFRPSDKFSSQTLSQIGIFDLVPVVAPRANKIQAKKIAGSPLVALHLFVENCKAKALFTSQPHEATKPSVTSQEFASSGGPQMTSPLLLDRSFSNHVFRPARVIHSIP